MITVHCPIPSHTAIPVFLSSGSFSSCATFASESLTNEGRSRVESRGAGSFAGVKEVGAGAQETPAANEHRGNLCSWDTPWRLS